MYELALWCGGHHIHITVTAPKAVVFSLRSLHRFATFQRHKTSLDCCYGSKL